MVTSLSNINNASGNNLAAVFTVRYRLASDPDITGSYTTVTATETKLGITYPFFDNSTLADGVYVLHTYITADGDTTGTKITIEVSGAGL